MSRPARTLAPTRRCPAPRTRPGAPSKTRRKKTMHALQDLGEALVALDPAPARRARPAGAPASTRSRRHARSRKHEGRRRQMQFIGRLMRDDRPRAGARGARRAGPRRVPADARAVRRGRALARATCSTMTPRSTRFAAAHPGSRPQRARARSCATHAPNATRGGRRTRTASCSASMKRDAAMPPETDDR